MPRPFNELRERLLQAGVAPRHVRRYLDELSDHLADLRVEEERAGRNRADAESAALVRLGSMDDLVRAMTGQRQFQSFSARVPWATFGLAPLISLAAAYFVACLILWSGWQLFLPGAVTPFGARLAGPIFGIENLYFQTGRMLYFTAPILVGWGVSVLVARQRFNSLWLATGLVPIAFIGPAAQVHTNRPFGSAHPGHVSMTLSFGSSVPGVSSLLLHALVILALAALPYLIWRLQKAGSVSV